ncbi:YtzI protein [Peribacillus huizhouensis]|uniref:Heme/copper-type cytochrome/quinol oxidase subunit 2 n=1 Tax=Peribacillus huizhouensis TaxID=1501239 RepID=A0ABR6CXJ3_9BACI|nr:YtzI protein [Peribacillus huizhouensis]MBA9029052.1 heme/copper-type cytochrome/quinol oxidase subunit 2 [Peribacillus huizhouensis]
MTAFIIISIIIVLVILALSVFTINKGYDYKHTIDPSPHPDESGADKTSDDKQ